MKWFLSYLILISFCAHGQIVKSVTSSNGQVIRFLEYGKQDGRKHPLMIFLHGSGERGSDINLIKVNGIADILTYAPDAILIAPQLPINFGNWPRYFIDEMLKYGRTLNVDTSQIIITGLSLGGGGIVDWAGQVGNSAKISALVPMCPACLYNYQELKNITVPTWAFVGDSDKTVPPLCTYQMQGQAKNFRYTVYKGGTHGTAWYLGYKDTLLYKWIFAQSRGPKDTLVAPDFVIHDTLRIHDTVYIKAVDTSRKVEWIPIGATVFDSSNNLINGTYQVELRITEGGKIFRDTLSVTVADSSYNTECNILPAANAGPDQVVKLGVTATISGIASKDQDGTILYYKWTKLKGPTKGKISYSTRATTTLTGLVIGEYIYELTVTDNKGGKAKDQVKITVVNEKVSKVSNTRISYRLHQRVFDNS